MSSSIHERNIFRLIRLDLLWIAFGCQFSLQIYEVNVERGIMMDLELRVKFLFEFISLNQQRKLFNSTTLEHSV